MNRQNKILGLGSILSAGAIAAFFSMSELVEPRLDGISVLSWNIICRDCPSQVGDWDERKYDQLDLVVAQDADVVGFQEIQHNQFDWFRSELAFAYDSCSPPIHGGERQMILAKKHLQLECTEQIALREDGNGSCDTAFIEGVKYFNCHLPVSAIDSPVQGKNANEYAMDLLYPFLDTPHPKVVFGDINSTGQNYASAQLRGLMKCSVSELPEQDLDKVCVDFTPFVGKHAWVEGRSDHYAVYSRFYNYLPAVQVVINDMILK